MTGGCRVVLLPTNGSSSALNEADLRRLSCPKAGCGGAGKFVAGCDGEGGGHSSPLL